MRIKLSKNRRMIKMEKITLLVMWFALLFLASPVFGEYAPPIVGFWRSPPN